MMNAKILMVTHVFKLLPFHVQLMDLVLCASADVHPSEDMEPINNRYSLGTSGN